MEIMGIWYGILILPTIYIYILFNICITTLWLPPLAVGILGLTEMRYKVLLIGGGDEYLEDHLMKSSQNGLTYPLVNEEFALENGHLESSLIYTFIAWWFSSSFCKRVIPKLPYFNLFQVSELWSFAQIKSSCSLPKTTNCWVMIFLQLRMVHAMLPSLDEGGYEGVPQWRQRGAKKRGVTPRLTGA